MPHPHPVSRRDCKTPFPLLAALLICLAPACASIPEEVLGNDTVVHLVQFDKDGGMNLHMVLVHELHSKCDSLLAIDNRDPVRSTKKIPAVNFAALIDGLADLDYFEMAIRNRGAASDSDSRLSIVVETPGCDFGLTSNPTLTAEQRQNLTDMVTLIMRHHSVPNLRYSENVDPDLFNKQQKKLQNEGNRIRYNK